MSAKRDASEMLMEAMDIYVVSDLAKGYDRLKRPYWRPTAMMNSIIAAKAWANPNSSIITVHTFEEANEIMANRELPSDYRIVG